jgi:hypothetical protein
MVNVHSIILQMLFIMLILFIFKKAYRMIFTDQLMGTHNCDGVELGVGVRIGVVVGLGW